MRRTIARPQEGARLLLVDAVAAARALLVARLRHAATLERPVSRGAAGDNGSLAVADRAAFPAAPRTVCEIACWRGYVKWQFYVKSQSPLEASFSSPYFRAGGGRAPERTDAALEAHAALVEKLIAAGWEQDGRGERWFSERFWRGRSTSA